MREYRTLKNEVYNLDSLSEKEKKIYQEVHSYLEKNPDWTEFSTYWKDKLLEEFKDKRVEEIANLPIFRICQDLSSRLGIKQGYIRKDDYRDKLLEIIDSNFRSRYEFCKKMGIDEGFLSKVLRNQRSLSLDNLLRILGAVGYEIEFKKKKEKVIA